MDGGALFRVHTESRTRVLTEMSDICLHKNEVGGYAYNDPNTILTQIWRFLERQLYEDSADGMTGLASGVSNVLNEYNSTIHIKKRDVLAGQERPPSAPAPTTALSIQRFQKTSTRRTNAIGRTYSPLLQSASRRGLLRGLPRLSGGTSQTPSSGRRTTAISSQWISFRSTDSSPPSQRGRRDQSQQTSGDSSPTSRGQFSTV